MRRDSHGITGKFRSGAKVSLVAVAALFASAAVSRATTTTLVSDDFNSVASGTAINGRTPTVSFNSSAWVGPSTTFTGNGAGGVNADTNQATVATVDVGSGYLASHPGTYDLSADLTQPAGKSTSSWVALGFAASNLTNQNFVGGSDMGAPWVLYRNKGEVIVFAGPANTIQLYDATTSLATTGSAHTFTLELNTTGSQWVLSAFIDGTQLNLNGTNTLGSASYTYTTNPSAQYAGLSVGQNGTSSTLNATVDNFALNVTTTPEPASALAGVAAIGLLARRRRVAR